jgi:hypothetical protein
MPIILKRLWCALKLLFKDGKKPYIGFCVSFFEDVNCIDRCLSSVLDNDELRQYSKMLCLDGKYRGYPIDHDLSEDGSRELILDYAKRYPGLVELYDFPNLHERFKRQRYVNLAAQQEIPYIIIMDSDEWIQIARVEKFIKELKHIEEEWHDTNIDNPLPVQRVGNVCQVPCVDVAINDSTGKPMPGHMMARPRLWYRPQDMHYTTKHYWFARKDEVPNPDATANFRQDNLDIIFNSKYKSLSVSNIVMWHSHQNRTEDRENRRRYYEFERLPKLEGSAKMAIFDKENIKQ